MHSRDRGKKHYRNYPLTAAQMDIRGALISNLFIFVLRPLGEILPRVTSHLIRKPKTKATPETKDQQRRLRF
jgi:hypothetical protein